MSRKTVAFLFATAIAAILIHACSQAPVEPVQGDWIRGNEAEKLEIIENQFRGFDMAMVETDYRYRELYWAGADENWDYAVYQAEKLQSAVEGGLQRRPARAPSAENFLNTTLPDMQAAAASRDSERFAQRFQALTNQCNMCHALEDVAFFTVKAPLERGSSIRF